MFKVAAVAATVFFGATTVGPISGGAFNPAVGTCGNVMGFVAQDDHSILNSLGIYLTAPFVGACFAAFLYLFVFKPNLEIKQEETQSMDKVTADYDAKEQLLHN
mmetsp:Transcript_4345/g.4857  ORF Transcript_4345/g.4857 Transcript_4345/m.4857 type:complete len:104 (+) Transcript_4345:617-928(+)